MYTNIKYNILYDAAIVICDTARTYTNTIHIYKHIVNINVKKYRLTSRGIYVYTLYVDYICIDV